MTVESDLRELRQLVYEKDELLKVLTERLESAAEQLDRLRRQGGVLEPMTPPVSLLDNPEVAEDFRQMLADWRDLQSRGFFGSLEDRLDGLHDLVSNLGTGPVTAAPAKAEESRPASVSEILARYGAETVTSEPADAGASAELIPGSPEIPAGNLELPEPPPPVDIENGSIEELRDALRLRDDYIARLSDYLLAFDAADRVETEGPDITGEVTAEQKAVMEAWEAKVRKELRQTQIQLWIERAQLSREQMAIQQMQHQLETDKRRLGMSRQKGAAGGSDDPADSQKSKNWLGLFGK